MRIYTWLTPRDHGMAGRTVTALAVVALSVTVAFLPLAPDRSGGTRPVLMTVAVAVSVLAIVLSAAAWFFDERTRWAWALCPLAAIAAITLFDLATSDASLAAQVFFLFPTLYAGSLLPRQGAAAVVVACIVGEATVVLLLLPAREAVVDLGYVAAVLMTATVMLVRFAERQADLVAELERRAGTDPLTGLVTRRAFNEACERALTAHAGEVGTSLILLDVDWFKSVNDRFGHPGGDGVLVQLSQLLVAAARRGDVVCRMGGDELAVLLPGCGIEAGSRRAEEMVSRVREHGFELGADSTVRLSVSAGLAHSPTHADGFGDLYAAADAALYRAKQSGRDRLEVVAVPA